MPQVKELKELSVAGPATPYVEKDFFVQLHLTEWCNLACRHCYQSAAGSGKEMSLRAVRRVIRETSDTLDRWCENYGIHFARAIHITGGEPLMRTDLFAVLAACKQHAFRTHLLSNGTLVDAGTAEWLKDVVDSVQVSIEGPESVHDAVRGQGSFARAARGIEAMAAANIPVTLNMTLSRLNMDCIRDLEEIAACLGAARVGISRLVPRGQGAGLASRMLGPERLRDVYAFLIGPEHHAVPVETGDPLAGVVFPSAPDNDNGHIPSGGCAAGVSGITVLPDGTLTPCRRCPVPLGNIMRDSLRTVWATSPILEALRDRRRYTGRCRMCAHWATCRGCRAVAYAHALIQGRSDMFGDDPQCWLKPHAA